MAYMYVTCLTVMVCLLMCTVETRATGSPEDIVFRDIGVKIEKFGRRKSPVCSFGANDTIRHSDKHCRLISGGPSGNPSRRGNMFIPQNAQLSIQKRR